VGATTAYALLLSGTAPEIVLINRNRKLAEGHAQDLKDAVLFSHPTRIFAGDFSDCQNADVIIVTAGAGQTAEMRSRLDDLEQSAAIVHEMILELMPHNPRGILLIASNPVDVLSYAAWKCSGLPSNRVIGSGTSLDTSRFRRRLGDRYSVASENVHAYIIGEHGDSQVPVLSTAQIAGITLGEFCHTAGLGYEIGALCAIANETRSAGSEIQRAKGATSYRIGIALTRIANAILRDEHTVLTVSSLAPESMGLGEVHLSLPSVISGSGVVRVLPTPLNEAETNAIRASSEVLKKHAASLNILEHTRRVC
jgi:L-lactate dehydrogenase